MRNKELQPEDLRNRCDPESLQFANTKEIEPLTEVIGQPRVFQALELGSEVEGTGFNIFVVGLPDSGRTTLTKDYFIRRAASDPTTDDWCYVENFDDHHAPISLRLPPGQGEVFKREMEELIGQGLRDIKDAFQSQSYREEKTRLTEQLKRKQEKSFNKLQEKVSDHDFELVRTPMGFILQPLLDGKPISQQERSSLSEEQRANIQKTQSELDRDVENTLEAIRRLDREIHENLKGLITKTVQFVIGPLISDLRSKYQDNCSVTHHLDALQEDLVERIVRSRLADKEELDSEVLLTRYGVNVLVDHTEKTGAPVVLESHPTYENLVGRIEHRLSPRGSQTDFSLIRPGALHRANGGYLLLPARDLLLNPQAWNSLKRALRDNNIRLQAQTVKLGTVVTSSLDPEPIPLDIKVILFGTPRLYYLLKENDEDFAKLFKIRAEFATEMDRTADNEHAYALFIKSIADQNDLPPFDNTAVARIIEYGSRVAENQKKLTTRLGKISNLIRESAYWANKGQAALVTSQFVQKAIQMGIYRDNLAEETTAERIKDDTILISVTGEKIGELNALTLLSEIDYEFGSPTRVSAVSRPGDEGVVAIERQAELSGPIHTKGVLILSGFLGERYGQQHTLNLTASITFEQSYAEVDGDSASAAELMALLSSIADIPLRQGCAITGSINQHGEIQAVGAINEKIEGYYRICQAKGLSGKQGVIIPKANVQNLMLFDDVLQAVEEGSFHIWPIERIDEGIPLLTGLEPGEKDKKGNYPPDTFNYHVQKALKSFYEVQKSEDRS
ncbi:MAG: AAA family ATPase [Anaerolineales bacterium]